MALLSRQPIPAGGLGIVLRHALAVGVIVAQIELSFGKALFRRFFIPAGGLGLIPLNAAALFIQQAQIELSLGIALLRRFAVPAGRFGLILRHALAVGIVVAQIELGLGVSLLRRLAVPVNGPGVVLLHAAAVIISIAFGAQGGGVLRRLLSQLLPHPLQRGFSLVAALSGGLLQPAQGLVQILLHAAALLIQQAQIEPGTGVALLRSFFIPAGRFGMILRHALAVGIVVA